MQNFHITPNYKPVPQTKKATKGQKKNNAGGYSFKITPFQALERFLILGVEGGTYYLSEKKQAKRSCKSLKTCLEQDPERTIQMIVDLSVQNRILNQDTAIFALAYCAAYKDEKVRALANANTTSVLRTFTHVAHYMNYSKELRDGMGEGFRKGVAKYYTETPVEKLSMHMLKYRQRDGWTHKDILALMHPRTTDPTRRALFQFATQGIDNMGKRNVVRERNYAKEGKKSYTWTYDRSAGWKEDLPKQVEAFVEAQNLNVQTKRDQNKLVKLITDYKLTHEMIPTEARSIPEVWEALAMDMPLGALIRNLSTFGRLGLLSPLQNRTFTNLIISKLENKEALAKSRLHPVAIYLAGKAYKIGHSTHAYNKSNASWKPVNKVLSALEDAFYDSFGFIEPTGKNFLLGIDCSASMDWSAVGGIKPREGAALMAMVTARVEDNYQIVGFNTQLQPLDISNRDSLDVVQRKMKACNWGGTDCAQPFIYAQKNNLEVDAFGVYTDNETWAGIVHPHIALNNYRKFSGIPAVSFVVGMTATNISIADPDDAGMLDLTGFDPSTPRVISEFVNQI